MPHARPAFRLGLVLSLVLSLLLGLLVGVATPAQAADGDLFSWGYNGYGQLGDGTDDKRNLPVSVTPDFPDEVVAVAGGNRHSLALLADGTVWAWGGDNYGQLGNGDAADDSLVPTQVSGLPPITAISAGGFHSVALAEDGKVWTWGSNDLGQLGNGIVGDAQLPVEVPSLSGVVDIAAGYFHTLALTGDGTVYAWGHNLNGQLGIGSNENQSTPVEVESLSDAEIVNIASGPAADVSLAITADGTLYEWGANLSGTGTRFTPVMVAGISDVVDASAGNWHVLALTADGTVYGWGDHLYNGTGDTEVTATPQWVMDGAVAVVIGAFHSLAIDEQGTLWSWGRNLDGQLGTGTNDNESLPVVVQTSLRFRAVAAGVYHSLAIEVDVTPPVTTATVNGEAPNDGWYQSATVALTTNEPATTTYEVGAGPTQTYTSPFVIPEGIYTITYRSVDASENVEDDQTLIVKVDGTAPTIQPIQSQTLDPVSPAGAPVVFTPVVTDNLTQANELVVTCVDQSDNPFVSSQYVPAGTLTTITCTVTDLAGNTASTIFTVEVSGSSDLFDELRGLITGLNLTGGTGQTLLTQVAIAEAMANAGQSGLACVQLTSLDLQIKAQESKRRIDRRDAAAIYALTQQIRNVIGCGGTAS